jgi:hypothetical protein
MIALLKRLHPVVGCRRNAARAGGATRTGAVVGPPKRPPTA